MRYIFLALLFISCAGLIGNEQGPRVRLPDKKDNPEGGQFIKRVEEKKMAEINSNSYIKRFYLENGMQLIVEVDHSAPVVAIQAWVGVGSADETDDIAGVAHLHEHMLFKGTTNRGVGEIARIIEENGGDINAWTSFDETVYHIVMPSTKLDMGLRIISDVLMNSTFDAKELAKEKEVVLEEIRQNKDIPQRRLIDELFSLSYESHPYKRPVIGYVDSVKQINRQKIYDFYKRYYVPKNIIIVVAGDVSFEGVLSKVQNLFSEFKGMKPDVNRSTEPEQRSPKIKIIKDKFVEAQIGVAFHTTAIQDEDTPALDLLSVLLGGSQSSKLRESIVIDKTLASDIFAYSYTPKDRGLFILGAGLPFANIKDTFKEMFNILNRYKYEKFSSAEVNKAIVQIESDDIFSMTTMQGRARKLGFYQLMTGNFDYGKRYLDKLRAITSEELVRVARKYFNKENMSVIVLLPDTLKEEIITEGEILNLFSDSENFYKKRESQMATQREIYKKVLKNGITLIVEQNPRLPIVSMRAVSLGGVRYENDKNIGISNFISRMLTRGNKTMNTFQIMRAMDNIGGSIGGYSGKNSLGLRAEFLSKYQDTGFKIFLDCLFRSEFLEDQIEKERRLILEEIKNREDDLTFQAVQLFLNTLYVNHPYKYDVLGSEESISKLTKDELISFYKKLIVPSNVVIAVVGDVEPHLVEQFIEENTSDLPDRRFEAIKLRDENKPEQVRRQVIFKEKEQAHIVVGFLGTTIYNKDRYALELLSVILGGQSGRLFVDLRDKKSLAYTVSSFNVDGIENGYFAIYLSCAHHKTKVSVDAIFEIISKLQKDGVKPEELEKAKNYLIGIHSIEMQEYSLRGLLYSLDELYGLGYDFHNKYLDLINSITLEDMKEVIKRYLDTNSAVISIVRSQVKE
ncbi:MAG: M16 family metallopeptidase [Myxococcota bacterium]